MSPTGTRRVGRSDGSPPVYALDHSPQNAPIVVLRLSRHADPAPAALHHAHSHDFLVIAYFERAGGLLRIGAREWPIAAGDVFVIAPGEVVSVRAEATTNGGEATDRPRAVPEAEGWAVLFPPAALGAPDTGSFLGWGRHPLLLPFVRGTGAGAQHLNVPPAQRSTWVRRIADLGAELTEREDGHREAATAHLTLLLIELGRLAGRAVPAQALAHDHDLAVVFTTIDERFTGPLTTADVAAAVGLTPEHLTTVVRRRTGRTVGQWITERRLAEARQLLTRTDLPVARISHLAGYPDPAYFTRVFRRTHRSPPARWRADATGR